MSMFPFRNSILSRVFVHETCLTIFNMSNKFSIRKFTPSITLKNFNPLWKLVLYNFLKLNKHIKYFRFLFWRIQPSVPSMIINKNDVIFHMYWQSNRCRSSYIMINFQQGFILSLISRKISYNLYWFDN